MECDKELVDQLIAMSRAAESNFPNTHVPTTMVPVGMQVADLSKYGQSPIFCKAKFSTSRITDFIAYLEAESQGEKTLIAISPKGNSAKAVIDQGMHKAPEWGFHTSILNLMETPEYEGLKAVTGQPMSQRELVNYFEDFAYCITPMGMRLNSDEESSALTVGSAIQIIRQTKVRGEDEKEHEEGDYRQSVSGMESITTTGKDGRIVSGFIMHCTPYEDTRERDIEVRIVSHVNGGAKPTFTLRIIQHDLIRVEVQEEIEERIEQATLEGARVFVGSID